MLRRFRSIIGGIWARINYLAREQITRIGLPSRIRPHILESDEAIVAVFAHEMFELEKLRPTLQDGATPIEQ
jgi:hypothetical protein